MWRRLRRAKAQDGRSGLSIDDSRVALACLHRANGARARLAAGSFAVRDEDDWAEGAAAGLDLRGSPLCSVMPTGSYQLLLVEVPNVPAEEVQAAVRWRIKDLIDYPIDEAVIDLCELPEHSNPAHKPMAYAVAARRSDVQRYVNRIDHAGLTLHAMDIPELCVRNVAVLLPQDVEGVAFLHLMEDCGFLTVTRRRVLYLIRRIEIGHRALAVAAGGSEFVDLVSGISLELQRSLDYYESQYDCSPITDLVVGPGAQLTPLRDSLREQLGLSVTGLTLTDLFEMDMDLSIEQQGDCLLAVGAALRPAEAA